MWVRQCHQSAWYDADVGRIVIRNPSPVPRVSRGTVSAGGAVLRPGTGDWTAIYMSGSLYKITFAVPFSTVPTFVATGEAANYGVCTINAGPTTSVVVVATLSAVSGAPVDSAFDFMAMG